MHESRNARSIDGSVPFQTTRLTGGKQAKKISFLRTKPDKTGHFRSLPGEVGAGEILIFPLILPISARRRRVRASARSSLENFTFPVKSGQIQSCPTIFAYPGPPAGIMDGLPRLPDPGHPPAPGIRLTLAGTWTW